MATDPATGARTAATPAHRVPFVLRVADALGGGSRATGLVTLGVTVCLAVLVPVLLVRLLGPAGPGAALLGLVLGLVVDLLVAVLLVQVVTLRVTAGRLREQGRTLTQLSARTTRLEQQVTRQGKELTGPRSAVAAAARTGVEAAAKDVGRRLQTATVREVGNRVQATTNLFALVPPRGPVPPLVGYVASPDVLLVLVQKLLTIRPSLAIECGSGTSTLFLALAVQQHGLDARIVSLEHQAEFAASTRALLAEHGVEHLADVRHAPLVPTSLPDHDGPWYDPAAWEDLHDIGLAFVDGPPADVSPQSRYPMVPLLADRLAPRCAILLDDANRPDERAVGDRWAPYLPGFAFDFLPLTRGAGLFERGD